MALVVTHRSAGSEAYLLRCDEETILYNRITKTIGVVEVPSRFAGRASWFEFDGDPAPILVEVEALLGNSGER